MVGTERREGGGEGSVKIRGENDGPSFLLVFTYIEGREECEGGKKEEEEEVEKKKKAKKKKKKIMIMMDEEVEVVEEEGQLELIRSLT